MADTVLFGPQRLPRVFGLAPGADFPAALVDGLRKRLHGQPPEAIAEVEILVNAPRMGRRIAAMFDTGGACFLPRIRLLTDLSAESALAGIAAPLSPLRRQLDLARLIDALLARQPDLAPRAARFDLAQSLSELFAEMHGEGVTARDLADLDVSGHSQHWERSLQFVNIAARYLGEDAGTDTEGHRRKVTAWLIDRWQDAPPAHPVLVAGSTGSRGTTAMLMRAVAQLPQGALVLPGFDFDLPGPVWSALDDAMAAEDHPQFRFRQMLQSLGLPHDAVLPWADAPAPAAARNRLISLALRPAPVTDQWLAQAPMLGDLGAATREMTLIEAPHPGAEAAALALILRRAAEDGVTAALVSPDRNLTRRVVAALDRWGLRVDDSGGSPLLHSAPGRFLRQTADCLTRPVTAEMLLALLKHPLAASSPGVRGPHLRWTRELELWLRRRRVAFPDSVALRAWAALRDAEDGGTWAEWLASVLDEAVPFPEARSLTETLQAHLALSARLAAGPGGDPAASGELWAAAAGAAAQAAMAGLTAEAAHGGPVDGLAYAALLSSVLSAGVVREAALAYPGLMIWGTLEARVQGAELVILAGLNDGTWPPLPAPDPWLNRRMRLDTGLLLPDRQVGLSAHDFQQAVAAPRVVLSRALRDAEAETVPSRWLNRLCNLLDGTPAQGGPQALARMRALGTQWVSAALDLDRPLARVPPARRPAPRPPVSDRPTRLSVTAITRLVRDPYAIYARHVLRLAPLDPLRPEADAALRGMSIHTIIERFVREGGHLSADPVGALMAMVDVVLDADVPWPAARAMWRGRLASIAPAIVAGEAARAARAAPVLHEGSGSILLPGLNFTLTARADRVDLLADGRAHIYDYKSGHIPTEKEQRHFDKQMPLQAIIAARGGFAEIGPREVAGATYIGVSRPPREVDTDVSPAMLDAVWAELHRLIGDYGRHDRGYPSRRAIFETGSRGDFDHLARFGEWGMTDDPFPEDVG